MMKSGRKIYSKVFLSCGRENCSVSTDAYPVVGA